MKMQCRMSGTTVWEKKISKKMKYEKSCMQNSWNVCKRKDAEICKIPFRKSSLRQNARQVWRSRVRRAQSAIAHKVTRCMHRSVLFARTDWCTYSGCCTAHATANARQSKVTRVKAELHLFFVLLCVYTPVNVCVQRCGRRFWNWIHCYPLFIVV